MIWNRKVRRLLGRRPAGRELAVFPDDTFVVSYTRSGNTWTRFLIANLMGRATLENISGMIPEIYLYPNRQLVRRDVATSLYHYSRKRRNIPDGYAMDEFVIRYLQGEFFDFCGTWQQHVVSWLYTQPGPQLLWLRYEDMLDQPAAVLTKIAEFMGIAVTPEKIASAVAASSYEQMRTMERERGEQWKMVKGTRRDIPFVRKAAKGAWRAELSKESQYRIESAWADTMNELLYPVESIGAGNLAGREAALARPEALPLQKFA